MNKTILIALAVALVTPFAAIADQNVLGVPDLTCQAPSAWKTHDYGAPATGSLVFNPQDGNLNQCTSVNSTWLDPAGDECVALASDPALAAVHNALCVADRPADWDGDYDFSQGGAWLASNTGDGVTSGSLACWDMIGHHSQGGNVVVTDVSGLPTAFTVTADFTDPASPVPPGTVDCGDGVVQPCDPTPPAPSPLPQPVGGVVDTVNALLYSLLNSSGTTCTPGDVSKPCVNTATCTVDFPPGADGAYTVFIGPSLTAGPGGVPTGATAGHIVL